MIEGLIIVNGCMRTEKFEEITAMYVKAAKNYGIRLTVCYNNEIVFGIDKGCYIKGECLTKNIQCVLFLDKDIRLARQFEQKGIRVFNSSHVIEICDDKAATFMALQKYDIHMPKTIIAPLIYTGTYCKEKDPYIPCIEKELSYPIVMKECYGSFGEQVYKVDSHSELVEMRRKLADKPHLYQAFVKSSSGRDVRIHVVGGEVVATMLRISDVDFRANISSGGRMEQFDCPQSFKNLAIEVCNRLGADFAGVDILFGEDGEPVLCEVNSNAHIKNILTCTGVNVAEKILKYIHKEVTEND